MPVNEYGQPLGDPVQWTPGPPLGPVTLTGRTCRLEPLDDAHVPALYAGLCLESPAEFWTYMSVGPFVDRETFAAHLDTLRAVRNGPPRDPAAGRHTDDDWPRTKAAFEGWLDPVSFDTDGRQRQPLRAVPDPQVPSVTGPGSRR